MKITVVGAILIVVLVTASILVLLAMQPGKDEPNSQQNGGSPPNHAL
jgi:hypothetical protein